ncbi:MAG: heme exporter protein CcmD [Moraxella sp.]|nr:heme exporter protein CcmD [Moraxella sp.]
MTPYFDSVSALVEMGGHGFYVWLCYALVFGAIVLGVYYAKAERKRTLKRLAINQARKQKRHL